MRRSSIKSIGQRLSGKGLALYACIYIALYFGLGLALLSTQPDGVSPGVIVLFGLAVFLVMTFVAEPLLIRYFKRVNSAESISIEVDKINKYIKP